MESQSEAKRAEIVEYDRPNPAPAVDRHGASVGLFGEASPAQVLARAREIAGVLAAELEPREGRRALYKEIHDRRHVLVEGWTLLGNFLGVHPVTVWTRQIQDGEGEWAPPKTERQTKTFPSKFGSGTYEREVDVIVEPGRGGWEARVEARTLDGRIVGAAEAECRWSESSWSTRDSYALRSMAQTRATSKALRMPLGFVVELAGFSATPAEEIPDGSSSWDSSSSPEGSSAAAFKCPACDSGVYDNRAENVEREAKGQRARPAFKCRSGSCSGVDRDGEVVTDGDPGSPWIAWSSSYFEARMTLDEWIAGAGDDAEKRAAARRYLLVQSGGRPDVVSAAWARTGATAGVEYPIEELLEYVKKAAEEIPDLVDEAKIAEYDERPFEYS